jgi:glucose/arabinose dehydrogenase
MRRRVGAALAVLCLGSIMAACVPAKEQPPPPPPPPQDTPHPPDQGPPAGSPSLAVDTNFVTGLDHPWDMAFLSDGTMFFTERSGPVKVRLPNGTINAIVTPGDVSSPAGDSGMMGIAIDPGFTINHFIYTCYTTSSDIRVVRWTVNLTFDGVLPPGDAGTPIVQGIPKEVDHFGCRTRFGPDGKLWFTIGDGAAGTNPQDLDVLKGKVLHVNSNGSAPSDNPFVNKPGDDHIYTYGHRNPQGIAFRPGNGAPYAAEHGPAFNDEVNQLVAGGNGGWDPVPGYNQSVPMTDFEKFPDAMVPKWRSGDSFTLAPSGCTFLEGPQWGSWDGALLVVFPKDAKARAMFLDGPGDIFAATPTLELGVRLRSAVEGPDRNLYIATDVAGPDGAIWKVVPS